MVAVIPKKLIDVLISLYHFTGVTSQQHGNMCPGEALAKSGKHRERENDIAKAVSTD
jgi:hypothetical protein